jgi:hypothetical protein
MTWLFPAIEACFGVDEIRKVILLYILHRKFLLHVVGEVISSAKEFPVAQVCVGVVLIIMVALAALNHA